MSQLFYDWPWKTSLPRLGFVGLGNMGAALATRLVGQSLSVFDNDPTKCDTFAVDGVEVAFCFSDFSDEKKDDAREKFLQGVRHRSLPVLASVGASLC